MYFNNLVMQPNSDSSADSDLEFDFSNPQIKYLDQINFLKSNSNLFKNKHILDLGCGDAYLKTLNFLCFASYTGLDLDQNSGADIIGNFEDPNAYEKTQNSPFDIILAFNEIPQNLALVHENLKESGLFFHSSSPYWYESNQIEERVKDYFEILDNSLHSFLTFDEKDKTYQIDSYFLVCRKK